MGLRDHAAKFEAETETNTATMNETAAMNETNNTTTETTTAVAPAKSTAVGAARKFEMAFAEQKDAFPIEAVVGLSLSVPRIKAEQGAAYVEANSLGTKFRIEVESWNHRWLISAGVDANDPAYKESMEFLKTSYDNQTVHGTEQTINEYLEYLRSIGYTKARVAPYIDLFGMVVWTEKGGDVKPEDLKIHLVQLSQTSAGNWAAFCTTQGLMRSKGMLQNDSNVIEVRAEAKAKGTMKYSNFSFSIVK